MHIMIINASPHVTELSNTAMILEPFYQGIAQTDSSFEIYHLAQRFQWEKAKKAFFDNDNIVFALPVFAAIIPGFMMGFLEELAACCLENQKSKRKPKIAFILQSGFPEACQRRCCENYLKTIPEILGGSFAGILSYGINKRFIENSELQELRDVYKYMGTRFVKNSGTFFFEDAVNFTGPEHISEYDAKRFNRMFNFFCRHISEEKGCTVSLKHQPYQCNNDTPEDNKINTIF